MYLCFIYNSKAKKLVIKEQDASQEFKKAKLTTLIMAIAFSVFLVFEIVGVSIVLSIAAGLEEVNIKYGLVAMSVVWAGIFTALAYGIIVNLKKMEKLV